MEEQKRIMLVDDDEHIRDVLMHAVRSKGYDVVLAESGSDALEMIKAEPPDLIVLDINMPGMNGFEVLSHIKKMPMTKDVPIIVFSALGSLVHPSVHINGVSRFLVKGEVRLTELTDVIGKLLADSSSHERNTNRDQQINS